LSDSQCSFSAFWRPENAISAHSSTGLVKKMRFLLIRQRVLLNLWFW